MKILLAVDGSASSLAAAKEVARRPWPPGSSIKVISAFKLPFVPTDETRSLPESDYSQLEKAERAQARAAMDRAQEILRQSADTGLELESEVMLGDAREVILDEAAAWRADLIVLGSRGLGGVKRFLLGSVPLGVLTQAPCSVQIVRSPQTATEGN
jgi:nucleotide-binding universal stress UspA family protein